VESNREAKCRSISKTMLNSIRPDAAASLLPKGEARHRKPSAKEKGNCENLCRGQTVGATTTGPYRVVGDGVAGRRRVVKLGSRAGNRTEFMSRKAPKSRPEGDRALVVARKRGNARGAKEGRKVET